MRRIAASVAFLAFTFAAIGGAHADGCPSAEPTELSSAYFAARAADGGLVWDARYVLASAAEGTLRFAVPLPEGTMLRDAAGVSPIREDGRIAGLCLTPDAVHRDVVAVTFVQPLALVRERALPLGAPVTAGKVVEIVDVSGIGAPVDVAANDLLVRHVGFVAAHGVSHEMREEARRRTDTRAEIATSPVFLRGDDVTAAGGLTARISEPPAETRTSAVAAGVAFLAVVLGLVLAATKLRRRAMVEHADAVLAADIDRLT